MLDEALNAMIEKHIIHACDAVALTGRKNGALNSAAFGIARSKEPDLTFENSWQAFYLFMDGLRIKNGENGKAIALEAAATKFA